jgi:hypothetical protein
MFGNSFDHPAIAMTLENGERITICQREGKFSTSYVYENLEQGLRVQIDVFASNLIELEIRFKNVLHDNCGISLNKVLQEMNFDPQETIAKRYCGIHSMPEDFKEQIKILLKSKQR